MARASKKKLYFLLILAVFFLVFLIIRQMSIADKISVSRSDRMLIDPTITDIPTDPNDPIFGNQGAPITILEFVDLNSKLSREIHSKTKNFVAAHPTEVRLIWKDLPAPSIFDRETALPHRAAWCVYKQDKSKFWNFIDLALNEKKITDINILVNLAKQINLNVPAWQQCLNSTETKARIESSISLARALGFEQAPAMFINNKKVNYLDEVDLEKLLEEVIKK